MLLLAATVARAGTVCPDQCTFPTLRAGLESEDPILELQPGAHRAGLVVDRVVEIVGLPGATVFSPDRGFPVFSVQPGGSGSVFRDLVYDTARTDEDGPLVSAIGADVSVIHATIESGWANYGTPVAEIAGGLLTLEDARISGNGTSGPGIVRIVDGAAIVRRGEFSGNYAPEGGAIRAFRSDVTVQGTSFVGAGDFGSAEGRTISVDGGRLVLEDATFEPWYPANPTAEVSATGAAELTVRGGTFRAAIGGPSSALRGIGVEQVEIDGTRFVGWTAGAVRLASVERVVVGDAVFDQNWSGEGGAIRVAGADALEIRDSWFCGNGAEGGGGAVWIDECKGDCAIRRSVFEWNTAIDGGAVFTRTALAVDHTTFWTNAASYGGAMTADVPVDLETSIVYDNGDVAAALLFGRPDVFRLNAFGRNTPNDATFVVREPPNATDLVLHFEDAPGRCGLSVTPTDHPDNAWLWANGVGAVTDEDRDGVLSLADCDDTDPTVFPGAEEKLGDGFDQDCDGLDLCRVDADGDGFAGDDVAPGTLGCRAVRGDCDDAAPDVHPDAEDDPTDGLDSDCDGTPEGPPDPPDPLDPDGEGPIVRIGGGCRTGPTAGWLGVLVGLALLRRRSTRCCGW